MISREWHDPDLASFKHEELWLGRPRGPGIYIQAQPIAVQQQARRFGYDLVQRSHFQVEHRPKVPGSQSIVDRQLQSHSISGLLTEILLQAIRCRIAERLLLPKSAVGVRASRDERMTDFRNDNAIAERQLCWRERTSRFEPARMSAFVLSPLKADSPVTTT